MDQRIIQDLVGELSTENIKLPENVPSFEKSFGETLVNKVIKDLKQQRLIQESSSAEVVMFENKVIAKINLVFNDAKIAKDVFNTKGAVLNLSQRWSYAMINDNSIFITFEVK